MFDCSVLLHVLARVPLAVESRGRYNEECIRIVNSKIDKVDKDAYTKFVGKVKADLKFIKGSHSEESYGTHLK